jgi:hypothetical protein
VAIPAIEDILSPARPHAIVAFPPVEHVIALVGIVEVVTAWSAVDDVVALASGEGVITAEGAYLVIAFTPVQLVSSIGAGKQAAFGAAG